MDLRHGGVAGVRVRRAGFLITLLVLRSVWQEGRGNRFIIAALVLSVIATVYLTFLARNLWQLWLLAIPSLLLVFLGARIYRSAHKR